jgi:hypothetical protein
VIPSCCRYIGTLKIWRTKWLTTLDAKENKCLKVQQSFSCKHTSTLIFESVIGYAIKDVKLEKEETNTQSHSYICILMFIPVIPNKTRRSFDYFPLELSICTEKECCKNMYRICCLWILNDANVLTITCISTRKNRSQVETGYTYSYIHTYIGPCV